MLRFITNKMNNKGTYQNFVKRMFPKIQRKFPTSKPSSVMRKVAGQWRKKKITQREPQLIGKGAYGCAYKPALKCNDEEDPNAVAKLMNGKTYDKEIIGATIMKGVDGKGQFSMKAIESCDIGDKDQPLVSVCNTGRENNPILVGQDIVKIIYSDEGNSIRTMVCPDSKDPNRAFRVLLNMLYHIIQGLQIMTSKGVVHADIKPDNIAILPTSKHAKLIDFGLVTTRNEFFQTDVYLSLYKYWPPEWITIMWLCYQKKVSQTGYPINISVDYIRNLNQNPTIKNLLENQQELFGLMKTITSPQYMQAMNTILSYGNTNNAGKFVTYVGTSPDVLLTQEESDRSIEFIQKAATVDKIYNRIFETWDVYGLGTTIYILYRGVCRSLFTAPDGSDLPASFVNLIDGMVTYDFASRFSPTQVKDMAKNIILGKPI